MPYHELFGWWIATITWSIAFPIAVSVYLYMRRTSAVRQTRKIGRIEGFAFVWFLIGLLVFYVISVGEASTILFAFGNVVVEGLLLLYIVRSSRKK